MQELVSKMKNCYQLLRSDDSIKKLYKYFVNKKYLVLFLKQYNSLITNMSSIYLLVDADNIEDSFTILRKYLETFFIMMSVIEHPDLVDEYINHDTYLSLKACNKEKNKIKCFCEDKPDGFLEYGYLEKYVTQTDNFKYTMKIVAEVANVDQFHYLYKMCNNFVHNNLTSVNINMTEGRKAIEIACSTIVSYMNEKINKILL